MGTPRRVLPPTDPMRGNGSSSLEARIARPPPSPKSVSASSGRSSSAPMPAASAASASATARPPSETSWTSEQRGAIAWSVAIELGLRREVERAGRPASSPYARLVLGAVERELRLAGEVDRVALAPCARHRAHVGDEADAADDRRGVDRAAVRLVVERDVARDDRDAERLARGRHALDRLGQLPGDLRLLGVAEVEAVGDRERLAAGAGDVARRLEHGQRAAGVRVEPARSGRRRRG